MIRNLDRAVFESELKRTLSPSSPIRTPEFLRGREKNLEQIRRAFVQPGRQVFIYGDRGVGKTSLALTAAGEHSLGRAAPILLNCRGSFFGIIQDLLNRISDRSVLSPKETENSEFSIANMVGFKKNKAREKVYVANVRSINDVVTALKELYSSGKSGQVVVFDEFELVDPPEERRLFGDFIKAISDQEVPLKAVFCGISDSVNSLLDNHPSAPRYLSAVELSS